MRGAVGNILELKTSGEMKIFCKEPGSPYLESVYEVVQFSPSGYPFTVNDLHYYCVLSFVMVQRKNVFYSLLTEEDYHLYWILSSPFTVSQALRIKYLCVIILESGISELLLNSFIQACFFLICFY